MDINCAGKYDPYCSNMHIFSFEMWALQDTCFCCSSADEYYEQPLGAMCS